ACIPSCIISIFIFISSRDPRDPHSFPTRRSSDLAIARRDLFPAVRHRCGVDDCHFHHHVAGAVDCAERDARARDEHHAPGHLVRSEEHTSELQSHLNLVCRLLLEKKKKKTTYLVS